MYIRLEKKKKGYLNGEDVVGMSPAHTFHKTTQNGRVYLRQCCACACSSTVAFITVAQILYSMGPDPV